MQCRRAIYLHHLDREKSVIESGKVGDFYKYVNNKLSSKTGVGSLKSVDGSFVTSNSEKAKLLNDFFGSVCTKDDGILPLFESKPDLNGLDRITVTPIEVASKINKLKTNSSAGPDDLPPIFFKSLVKVLAGPLAMLFNSLLSIGGVPSQWRTALVTPIFKKGSSSDVNNYRPISLTCLSCKLLESVVKDRMMEYLVKNNLITKSQHGFLKKHSTTTNILESLNDWTLKLNNRDSITVAYIDFAKAFDSVCHNKLIYKLGVMGIGGPLLKWIKGFLSDRTQRTVVGQCRSTIIRMESGVPQGSVLGPLLFLLFINDIADIFDPKITVKLFADDVKLYTIVNTVDDCNALQTALNKLVQWSKTWQLPISVAKCSIRVLGLSKGRSDLYIGANVLPEITLINDLGVGVDHRLKFDHHIGSIVNKAHVKSNLILRCFLTRDYSMLVRAFTAYVRPSIEYCSVIWSPSYIGLIEALESVQRRFTKRLPGLRDVPYLDRLNVLGLRTLEYRRLVADLTMCYKIIHGLIALDINDFFTLGVSRTRGHNFKLAHSFVRINARKHFFSMRVIPVWNSLPNAVVDSSSLVVFVKRLQAVDLSKHLITS